VNHCDFEKTGTSEIRAMAMDNGVSFGQCWESIGIVFFFPSFFRQSQLDPLGQPVNGAVSDQALVFFFEAFKERRWRNRWCLSTRPGLQSLRVADGFLDSPKISKNVDFITRHQDLTMKKKPSIL
jgi:hypothetical protein